jgi:hypothetical protein
VAEQFFFVISTQTGSDKTSGRFFRGKQSRNLKELGTNLDSYKDFRGNYSNAVV